MSEVDVRSSDGTEELLSLSGTRGVVPRSEISEVGGRADSLEGYKVVRPGQIVMNKMQAWNGMFGLSEQVGIVSPDYAVFAPRDPRDGPWLTYLLRSDFYVSQFAWRSRGMGTAFLRLHPENLLDTPLATPPPDERRAIADYLDLETARIDTLVTTKRRMLTVLRARRAAVTAHAVAGQQTHIGANRPTKIPWLPEIPKHWKEGKLRYFARLGSGHTPSRAHPEWWVAPSIPWITTGEVAQIRDDRVEVLSETREQISELGMANSSAVLHPAGTVVLSRTASLGYSAIMGTDMATSQDFATWTCGPLLRGHFLLLCLRAMRQDLLGRLAMGSTHKTIYMPDIESIRIPVPPLQEQDLVVGLAQASFRDIDAAHLALERQLELLPERRRSLVTEAVMSPSGTTG